MNFTRSEDEDELIKMKMKMNFRTFEMPTRCSYSLLFKKKDDFKGVGWVLPKVHKLLSSRPNEDEDALLRFVSQS